MIPNAMARPDMTEERTAQILDAFERCIVRSGLAGSSLEDVATEAGVKRSLIRHYVGNRDDLVRAMADRYAARYARDLEQLAACAAYDERIDLLVDALLPPPKDARTYEVILAEALIAASDEYPEVKGMMVRLVKATVDSVLTILRAEYPEASRQDAWDVAYGVVGVCFNHESLVPLTLPPGYWRSAKSAVRRLIGTLA